MQKVYCFVDESGQDTLGSFFVVATLVVKNEKEKIEKQIEDLEKETGKRKAKWNKAVHSERIDFVTKLISNKSIKGNLYYSLFEGIGYDFFTILSIAKVINQIDLKVKQKIAIYVDGLTKNKALKYTVELRKLGVKNCRVKGVRKDENNVFIRIVDSIAGFTRYALYKKDKESKKIFEKALKSKSIKNI